MKTCAYCATENRDEAIFCTHCRRPLQASQSHRVTFSRNPLVWILMAVILFGLGSYLLSSLTPFTPTTPTPPSNGMAPAGPLPTRTREPVTLSVCVRDSTNIRRSPSTRAETIGGLTAGACLTILGRNEQATWVYIVSQDFQTGWVSASLVREAGDINRISVRDLSGMAGSARPTLTGAELAHGAQVYLTQVAATTIAGSPLTRYVVPCFETADRIGDHISCRIERAHCDYLPEAEGSPTVCSDRPYPDPIFRLIALGDDWSDYDGQCIVVSGYLQVDKGLLQIQALQRDQVSYCN